jgi:hypothetical protein
MAESLPLAHRRLREAQVFRRDSIQRDEQVVVRLQLDVIAGGCRTIQDHAREIISVRHTQIFDESVQSLLHCCLNHLSFCVLRILTERSLGLPTSAGATAAEAAATTAGTAKATAESSATSAESTTTPTTATKAAAPTAASAAAAEIAEQIRQ